MQRGKIVVRSEAENKYKTMKDSLCSGWSRDQLTLYQSVQIRREAKPWRRDPCAARTPRLARMRAQSNGLNQYPFRVPLDSGVETYVEILPLQ
jgi:hypothetical protein